MSAATATEPRASLVTQAFILENYGLRLDLPALAKVLGITVNTIYNQRAAGTFPVKTYVEGTKVMADYRDVAAYFDECRRKAA